MKPEAKAKIKKLLERALAKGAHFVLVGPDKLPIGAWRERRPTAEEVIRHQLASPGKNHTALVPGSMGLVCVDGDLKDFMRDFGEIDGLSESELAEAIEPQATELRDATIAWLDFLSERPTYFTKSGGFHMWEKAGESNESRDWKYGQIIGDRKYAVLWSWKQFEAMLLRAQSGDPLDVPALLDKYPPRSKRPEREPAAEPDPAKPIPPRGEYPPERIAEMLAGLDPADFASYDLWSKLAMAVEYASDGEAKDEFEDFSRLCPGFSDFEFDKMKNPKKWETDFKWKKEGGRRPLTGGYIRHLLRDAGREDLIADPAEDFPDDLTEEEKTPPASGHSRPEEPPIFPVDEFGLEKGLKLLSEEVAFDSRAMQPVRLDGLDASGEKKWEAVDELFESKLRMRLRKSARMKVMRYNKWEALPWKPSAEDWKLLRNAYYCDHQRDPVLEYFKRYKGRFSGEPQLLPRMLSIALGVEESPYTAWVSELIWVGVIDRVFSPGTKWRTLPVLSGDQGLGKSSFVREVMPPSLRFAYADSFHFNPKKEYEVPRYCRLFTLIEWAELSGLLTGTLDPFKSWYSAEKDAWRPLYFETVAQKLKNYFIVGTINPGFRIPYDESGHSRFVKIDCFLDGEPHLLLNRPYPGGEIFDGRQETYRDRCFAEAAHLALDRGLTGRYAHVPAELEDARDDALSSIDGAEEAREEIAEVAPWGADKVLADYQIAYRAGLGGSKDEPPRSTAEIRRIARMVKRLEGEYFSEVVWGHNAYTGKWGQGRKYITKSSNKGHKAH